MKLTNQQVARAGEAFVVAEIHRRGGYATAFAGNMPAIDAVASDREQSRLVFLQIKTKTVGDWQTSTKLAHRQSQPADERHFWVLVDLGTSAPSFYILPRWWLVNWLWETTRVAVARRQQEGKTTTHARIHARSLLDQDPGCRDAWDRLAIGLVPPAQTTSEST